MNNTLEEALKTVQAAVTRRFGTKVETVTGRCTLEIAHDRIELNGSSHRVIGEDLAEVVRELERA